MEDFSRHKIKDYKYWTVSLHGNQAYLGRCVIWCKREDALDLADATPEEQKERLMERLKDPGKMWKYNEKDFEEAKYWDDYRNVYEDCFENCNKIPWTIVPADQNWYKEYIIATALYDLLKGLDMKYPVLKK